MTEFLMRYRPGSTRPGPFSGDVEVGPVDGLRVVEADTPEEAAELFRFSVLDLEEGAEIEVCEIGMGTAFKAEYRIKGDVEYAMTLRGKPSQGKNLVRIEGAGAK